MIFCKSAAFFVNNIGNILGINSNKYRYLAIYCMDNFCVFPEINSPKIG